MNATRIVGWVILGLIILGAAIWSLFNINFYKESFQELKKVTWPSKNEAINSAMITIGFIIVLSLFLTFVDYIIQYVLVGLVG